MYDAITGKPVAPATSPQPTQHAQKQAPLRAFSDVGVAQHPKIERGVTPNATAMHSSPQKSHTLYRKALKKPIAEPITAKTHAVAKAPVERSPLITKFGAQQQTEAQSKPVAKEQETPIAPAQVHPTVAKVIQKQAPQPQVSGTELKEKLIKERLAEAKPAKPAPKKAWFKSKPRLATVLTTTLALLVLGGYLTYMNLPVISMKVAATRAGVAATLPSYHPDGYSLNGPITYSPGEVDIAYKSNTNDENFKISQKQSNWDSQGLLDNYVSAQTQNYLTYQEHGVTVYTFGNKAAWVNGGLLYTLDGSASLSSDQVLRLATSM